MVPKMKASCLGFVVMLNRNRAPATEKAYGANFFRSILLVYLTVTDYFQHVIALHDIADYFDNKRSVSEIICGAEHELGFTTRRSLSRFKIQGCLCEVLKGVHSAFASPFI